MRRHIEIREIRYQDLRGVFLLGGELLPRGEDAPYPWSEAALAGVMAEDMAHSFVAAGKKTIEGFLIGRIAGGTSADILWTCTRGREAARLQEELYHAFEKSLPPSVARIRIFLPTIYEEMADFFGKFGFTLSKPVVIMENFFRKKS